MAHRPEEHRGVAEESHWLTLVLGPLPRASALVFSFFLAAALAFVVWDLSRTPVERVPSLTPLAMEQLPRSGVENPVTAVLLNYRAYDTLLELGVLWLAVMGCLAMLGSTNLRGTVPRPAGSASNAEDDVLRRLVGLFVPLMLLAGSYLLWRGTHAAGGAFQGGALLGAAGVLAWLAGMDRLCRMPGLLLRGIFLLGFALFLIVGLVPLAQGSAFLVFDPEHAGTLIFVVELAATLSIAASLWALYVIAGQAR